MSKRNSPDRDGRVLQLYEQLLEIEQRLIPTGLHIFGRPSVAAEKIDLLKAVAAFDRPEVGVRSLPDLVAEGSNDPAEQREHILTNAVSTLVSSGIDPAAAYLEHQANV